MKPTSIVGRTAYDREDKKDAKRGHPDVDLRAYAEARGLRFLDRQNPAGFIAVAPLEEQLQHNVMRGDIGGDTPGALWHWRYPIAIGDDGEPGPGTWHGTFVNRGWFGNPLKGLKDMINGTDDYVAAPCTAAAARVPEAALLPDIVVHNWSAYRFGSPTQRKLDDLGLRGYHLFADPDQPGVDLVLQGLASGPLHQILRAGDRHALFELRIRHGALCLRRNGYAKTEGELDGLLEAVRIAAGALRELCAPTHDPRPFAEALPPARWGEDGPPLSPDAPLPTTVQHVRELAEDYTMVLEDPVAYHHAFPSLPVPGTAYAVLRGPVAGAGGLVGRLALHTELPVREVNSGQTALLLPAPGVADMPRTTWRRPDGLMVCVRDGIFAAYQLRHGTNGQPPVGDVEALIEGGLAAAEELGVLRAAAA